MDDLQPESGTRAKASTPPPFRSSANATAETAPPKVRVQLNYWRILRLVFAIQGLYYAVTGLWPLLARVAPLPMLYSATGLGGGFAGTIVQAFTALLGIVLLLTVTRPRPDGLLVGLGVGSAAVFFLTELQFRTALAWPIYLDLVAESFFFLVLGLGYLVAVIADRRRR